MSTRRPDIGDLIVTLERSASSWLQPFPKAFVIEEDVFISTFQVQV